MDKSLKRLFATKAPYQMKGEKAIKADCEYFMEHSGEYRTICQ